MSVTKIISGSGIDINPIDGTGDVTVSTNGDMTVTNLIPSYQSTMLNYITSATQLVFSGDSITFDTVPNSCSTLLSEKYNKEKMMAPVVVAKGADFLALRIRELAKEVDVPIVENVMLARTMYKTIKVGGAVPRSLYQAVAEVLAFVYRLKKKKKALGYGR
jgi:type III secretion system FlhB-like substrate exporter